MDLMEGIRGRRAVRTFKSVAVERAKIEALIDAANRAPSAMNLQPWIFAVVEGADRLRGFSTRAKRHLLAAMQADSPLAKYRGHLEDPAYNIFHDAPCLIVVCARPPARQSDEDCCLAGQNLMLAAHAQGLGTCWIGFARPWLELAETRAELGLPSDCTPVAPIVVGVPAAVPPPVEHRKPVVVWCAPRVLP